MIDKIDENTLKITITGKHLSKNKYATLGLWGSSGQYAYTKAIKKAAEEYTLLHRKKFQDIKKDLPFAKATVKYTFLNPYSRDSDANQDTVKKIQDVMTELGLIIDDSRKYLIPDGAVDEVITDKGDEESYKVEALLRRVGILGE